MAYFVNQSNRIVEVDDEKLIKRLKGDSSFREATDGEIITYRSELNQLDNMPEWTPDYQDEESFLFPDTEADYQLKNRIIRGLVNDTDLETIAKVRKLLSAKDITSKGVMFHSVTDFPDGYGQSSALLLNAFINAGIDISSNFNKINKDIGLLYSYPYKLENMREQIKLIYTMFESTKIPTEWIEYLNMADRVFVPSKFCQEAFKSRGIKSTVIPLGYDSDFFVYKEKEESDKPFTFLHYNSFNTRKGWDIVFNAFTKEFEKDMNVKLVMKTIKRDLPFPIVKSQYPNIQVIKGAYTKEQLRELIYDSDCFVFPSRGEGFGLTPLENLACGNPVIIPNGSGMSEYFDDKYFYEIKIKEMKPAMYENFASSDTGEMIEPDVDDLRKQMRYVYEHRDEAIKKAKKGATWVKRYSIHNTAKKFKTVFDKLV